MSTPAGPFLIHPLRALWWSGVMLCFLGGGVLFATDEVNGGNEADASESSALRRVLPSAGAHSRTLVISDAPALPFSLLDVRLVVAGLLSRVQTEIHLLGVEEVTGRDLDSADYIILLGVSGDPRMFEILRQATRVRTAQGDPGSFLPSKPLWLIGTVAVGAAASPADLGSPLFSSWPEVDLRCGPAQWTTPLNAWAEGRFGAGVNDTILAEVQIAGQQNPQPLAWKKDKGAVWHFRALPVDFLTGRVFAEVALEFFGGADPGPSGVVVIFSEVAEGGDPGTVRRLSDWALDAGVSFGVGFRWPEKTFEPTALHDFGSTLRYVQARGGRLLLQVPEEGWWNRNTDAPPVPEKVAQARGLLAGQLQEALGNQFLTLGIVGPRDGASQAALGALGELSQLRVGPWQVSEATASVTFSAATVLASQPTANGIPEAVLVPEAVWWKYSDLQDSSWETARQLLALRGSVLVVTLPAWEDFDRLKDTLEQLRHLPGTFLDLQEASVAVTTPTALLRGRGLSLQPGLPEGSVITAEAFDSHGQELLKETPAALPEAVPAKPAEAVLWLWQTPQNP